MREMRKLGLECGLTLEDARMELDNYDFHQLWNLNKDQTLGSAQAQVTFIFLKA
jgi:hypothetical protein